MPNIGVVIACENSHVEFWVSARLPDDGCIVCRTTQRLITRDDARIKFYWDLAEQYGREGLENFIAEESAEARTK